MFCRNCGKEIPDAATFCPHCGANNGTAPVNSNVAMAPKAPSVIFPNMGKWIKCLFSKQAIASLDTIAKDTSLTGLVGVLFECCAAAMLIALIPVKTMSSVGNLIGSFTGGYGMSSFGDNFLSFFKGFFMQFFFIALILAALLGVLHIVLAVNHKKASAKQTLNVMFYALMPMGFVFAAGFVLTLLSMPLGLFIVLVFSMPSYLMTIILLYNGITKVDTFENDPLLSFSLFSILFTFIAFIIIIIDVSTGVGSAISSATQSFGNSFGSLF